MKMNVNSHFSNVPKLHRPRTRMDMSHGHKTTFNAGDLVPIYVDPYILPGSTVSIDTGSVIRAQTMLTPVMDSAYVSIFWFFVPYRLVWDHWNQMMGENTSSPWLQAPNYPVPKLKVHAHGATWSDHGTTHTSCNDKNSLLDYYGYPVEMDQTSYDSSIVKINALPYRAYAKVVNDWFISQAVTDPVNLYTGDSDQDAYDDGSYIEGCARGGKPFVVCKNFDVFTSCLPQPQKGPVVTIPFADDAPVVAGPEIGEATGWKWPGPAMWEKLTNNGTPGSPDWQVLGNTEYFSYNGSNIIGETASTATSDHYYAPSNLWADLSSAAAVSINQLRFAFQLQKFYERLSFGSRYTEIIENFFNVTNPDARLQRSEYLGGNRFPITVDQVTNTAQSSGEYLGDVGAVSRTGNVGSSFTKSFSEHGVLLGLLCVRSTKSYCQGLQPWMKFEDRLSWYWPTFDAIGNVGVDRDELYLGGSGTFGYQEAWYAWRYRPNRISAEFRPYLSGSLASWHYGDDYNAAPSLSDSWMREDKTNIDRTLTVTSANANQFWGDFWFKAWYTQPMSMYSVPGLIDHF